MFDESQTIDHLTEHQKQYLHVLENPSYEVHQIQAEHRRVIRLVMRGFRNGEIAEMTGLTSARIAEIRRLPIVQKQLLALESRLDDAIVETQMGLASLIPDVMQHYRDVLEDDRASPNLKFKVGQDVLDRVGVAKVQKHENKTSNLHLTAADIEEIKKNARENGHVVPEAEVVTVEEPENG